MPTIAHAAVAAAASASTTVTASASGPTRVLGVYYRPVANVTGQNTNTRLLRLRNTTTVTDIASVQLNAGTNLVGGRWNRIPLLVNPLVAVAAVAGNTLAFESNAVGTGIADPGGSVRVVWEREQSAAQRTTTGGHGVSVVTPPELALDVDAPTEPTEV
jgi:hypothetical protein